MTLANLVDHAFAVKPAADQVVYWKNDQARFTPRRGFEAALLATLGDDMLSVDEAVNRLLESGLYERVAPQAAALRPAKPVSFLLRTWADQGILRRSA